MLVNLPSHIHSVSLSSGFPLFIPETGNILMFLEGLKAVILCLDVGKENFLPGVMQVSIKPRTATHFC